MQKITIRLFYISLFLTLPLFCYSQNLDSLEKRLEISEDKYKVAILNQLSEIYISKNNSKGIEYGIKALELSKEYKIDSEEAKSLKNLGKLYYVSGNLSDALTKFYMAIQVFEKMNQKENIIDMEIQIGDIYYDLKDYYRAMEMYLRALDSTNKFDNKALLLNNIGNINYRNGNY